jgi:hypothetical protein
MDTHSVRQVADLLGVPSSRVLSAARSGAVPAAKDAQGRWQFPAISVDTLRQRWGAVPVLIDGLDRISMLTLALLSRRPRGIPSVRDTARLIGVSPTTATKALENLEQHRLVQRAPQRRMYAGRTVTIPVWTIKWDAPDQEPRLAALHQVVLPAVSPPPPPSRLPPALWHLVWNGDPSAIRLPRDAAFIAGRVLDAADPEAEAWAAQALPPDAWIAAAHTRGRSPQLRRYALYMSEYADA